MTGDLAGDVETVRSYVDGAGLRTPPRRTDALEALDRLASALSEAREIAKHPGFASRSGDPSEACELIAELLKTLEV